MVNGWTVLSVTGLMLILAHSAAISAQSAPDAPLTPEENFEKAREYVEKEGDFFSAMPYLRPAADAGIVRAQVWLAEYLDYGEQNLEAERYFSLAVAQGDAEGKMGLAIMHIAKDVATPDLAFARRLMEEAATDGFTPAVKAVAAAYITGGLGISEADRGSQMALAWIKRAAELGDLMALQKLEAVYRNGELGEAPDPNLAELYRNQVNKVSGVLEIEQGGRRRRR